MKLTDYFIKYDQRRDKTTIKPMGVVLILLVLILMGGAVFGVWNTFNNKVDTVEASMPTADSNTEDGQPADTSSRPVNWSVSVAEDMGDGVVRYSLPPEIEQMAYDDIDEAFNWFADNLKVFSIDKLEKDVELYYTDAELERMQASIRSLKEVGQFGLPLDEQSPPYGLARLAIEGVLPDGKTVYVRHTIGARKMAYYNSDGSTIEGSTIISLPPEQHIYRLVFNETLRRWQIAEHIEGPIVLPDEGE